MEISAGEGDDGLVKTHLCIENLTPAFSKGEGVKAQLLIT
jgi:hypothetical protein